MAYNYSNPFTPAVPSAPRSTFTAATGQSSGMQVLFSGLPLDVAEKDLRDLLLAEPMTLPASTTRVRCLHNSTGQFLGLALVQVENEADAERIRRAYSGQLIDATFRLAVQHILPSTQPLPSTSVMPFPAPMVVPMQPAAAMLPQQPKQTPKANANAPLANGTRLEKAPGLKLLARISKPAQARVLGPKEKQLALLAQQKANLGKRAPGAALLSRLAIPSQSPSKTRPIPSHASKSRPKQMRLSSGSEKVGRAKVRAGKDGMEVDVDPNVRVRSSIKEKAEPKTQQQLDEEMRAWERTRRFAAT